MTEYNPTVKTTVVNVANKTNNHNQTYQNRKHNATTQQQNTTYRPRRQPLQNTQCLACKTFGHKTQDCNIVGKILAVMDLHSKKPELCQRILQSHVNKNTPSRRLAIVKTLQDMQILPNTIPANEYVLQEDVDDHITATVNATDCTVISDPSMDEHIIPYQDTSI